MATHCAICGYPTDASEPACPACGAEGSATVLLSDAGDRSFRAPKPDDYPELKSAFAAWKSHDYPRLVGQCLQTLHLPTPQATSLADGPGWAIQLDDVPVFISFHRRRDELRIDCPLVLLNRQHHVAMLRAALEINSNLAGASCICLREDRLLLRYADRMSYVSPPKLIASLRETARQALALGELLRVTFGCEVLGRGSAHKAQAYGLDWHLCGAPRPLGPLTDGLLG
jgi:hypothetical protein